MNGKMPANYLVAFEKRKGGRKEGSKPFANKNSPKARNLRKVELEDE